MTKDNTIEYIGFTALGLIAGYFIGKKFKINPIIGSLSVGGLMFFATPTFIKAFGGNKKEEKSGFTTGGDKARKCWCTSPHGMVQCPCGGNSEKPV